jgi:hypothetical protein
MYDIGARAAWRLQASRPTAFPAGCRAVWTGGRAGTRGYPPLAKNWLLDPAAAASCGGRGPPVRAHKQNWADGCYHRPSLEAITSANDRDDRC